MPMRNVNDRWTKPLNECWLCVFTHVQVKDHCRYRDLLPIERPKEANRKPYLRIIAATSPSCTRRASPRSCVRFPAIRTILQARRWKSARIAIHPDRVHEQFEGRSWSKVYIAHMRDTPNLSNIPKLKASTKSIIAGIKRDIASNSFEGGRCNLLNQSFAGDILWSSTCIEQLVDGNHASITCVKNKAAQGIQALHSGKVFKHQSSGRGILKSNLHLI
mmetsp:Transcript_48728/g.114145  ORF Transcript_48728/g.114145 Transcript_48728/m.114145 type:complete len:218 (+) Transcript_48728:83-736(+)